MRVYMFGNIGKKLNREEVNEKFLFVSLPFQLNHERVEKRNFLIKFEHLTNLFIHHRHHHYQPEYFACKLGLDVMKTLVCSCEDITIQNHNQFPQTCKKAKKKGVDFCSLLNFRFRHNFFA